MATTTTAKAPKKANTGKYGSMNLEDWYKTFSSPWADAPASGYHANPNLVKPPTRTLNDLPSYANTFLTGNVTPWQKDPNLGKASGLWAEMFSGENSLAKGPQNAFNGRELDNLYTQALDKINAKDRAFQAGVGQANAARGLVGNNLFSLLRGSTDAGTRGALAQGNLDAVMAGKELGLQNYQARGAVASSLGSLADSEAARTLDRDRIDRDTYEKRLGLVFDDYSNTRDQAYQDYRDKLQALNAFRDKYGQMMATGSGGDKGTEEKQYLRRMFQDLSGAALGGYNQMAGYW